MPYASQPEAGWPAWLPASVPAWAEPVAVAQPELVERCARAQGQASQPASVPAWAEPVAVVQPELVEHCARAQGRVSQPVPA